MEFSRIIFGLCCILIDIFNLAEQIAIYCIVTNNISDQFQQRLFFYVFLGIGSATLFKPMLGFESLRTIYSILIEIGEFVAYINLSNSTNELTIVAGVFFALELLFHLINLIIAFYIDINEGCPCIKSVKACCIIFCIGIPYYVVINVAPTLHLFLDPNSPFRDTYYEILTILNLWFGTALIEFMIEASSSGDSPFSNVEDNMVAVVWNGIRFACSVILILITTITQIVLTSNALRDYDNGKEALKDYDMIIYYITLAEACALVSTIFIASCCLCCCLICHLAK